MSSAVETEEIRSVRKISRKDFKIWLIHLSVTYLVFQQSVTVHCEDMRLTLFPVPESSLLSLPLRVEHCDIVVL